MANPLEQLYPNKDALRVGATLGDLLTGNVGTKGLREDTLMNTYKTEMALQQAREKRGDAIRSLLSAEKFQALPQDAAALGYNPRDVNLLQLGANNSNASQLGEALLKSQELGFRGEAVNQATLGNMPKAQAQLMGLESGVIDLNKVEGGVSYDPTVSGGKVVATPLGEATIAQKLSSVTANNARANASNSTADKNRLLPKRLTQDQIAAMANQMVAGGESEETVENFIRTMQSIPELQEATIGAPPPKKPSVDAKAKPSKMGGESVEMAKLKAQAVRAIESGKPEAEVIAVLEKEIARRKLRN